MPKTPVANFVATFKRYHVWIGGRKPLKQTFETLTECFALVRETGKTGERVRVFDALPYSMSRTLCPLYDSAFQGRKKKEEEL